MSILRYAIVLAALAVFPAGSHAAGPGIVPWGETFCDPVQCVTPVAGTPERWTFRWAEQSPVRVTDGWQQTYVFDRYHPNRSNHPWQTVTQLTYFPDSGGSSPVYGAGIQSFPELNTVQCGYLNYAAALNGEPRVEKAGPGVTTTPAVLHGCFPDVFDEQGHWIPPANPTPDPVVEPPAKAVTCAAITVAKKRVAVTSAGLQCSSARNVLARFMRNGTEPAGWVCSRLSSGKARSATCGTPARAAKRIVGRWRV